MTHYNSVAGISVKGIAALPFLPLLKVIMDWTFSVTSLDLFQWFKLEDIHLLLYKAKLQSVDRQEVKPGDPVAPVLKFGMGWCALIILLLLIFGPLVLFSSLNPASTLNPVANMEFSIGLKITNSTSKQSITFPLYSNNNIMDL